MTRLVLRYLNSPILILLVAVGIAIQTSVFASYPLLYLQPDVILIAVIWCALKREFTEGGVLTLIFANLAEIHSAAPSGLFFLTYMSVYLGIRLISKLFVIPDFPSLIRLTLFASIFWKLAALAVLYFLDKFANQWRHTLILLLPGAVMEGVIAIWLYRWLEKFDHLTYKSLRAQQLEDELQLEGEGL